MVSSADPLSFFFPPPPPPLVFSSDPVAGGGLCGTSGIFTDLGTREKVLLDGLVVVRESSLSGGCVWSDLRFRGEVCAAGRRFLRLCAHQLSQTHNIML